MFIHTIRCQSCDEFKEVLVSDHNDWPNKCSECLQKEKREKLCKKVDWTKVNKD